MYFKIFITHIDAFNLKKKEEKNLLVCVKLLDSIPVYAF